MKMEIDLEKVNTLSQLDKIEFRQQEDRIFKHFDFSFVGISSTVIGIMILVIFMIDVEFLLRTGAGYSLEQVIYMFNVLVILFVGSWIADLFVRKKRQKSIDELEERFFEIKLRGKK